MLLNRYSNRRIERAIVFLVREYSKSGRNPKPIILHSLRSAFYLLQLGYNYTIVTAAILHDLIEDSNITHKNTQAHFGDKIADLVSSLTFDPKIKNKEVRYQELFERVRKKGKDALIVKCADIYDNSFYIQLVKSKKKQSFLLKKVKYFLDLSKKSISRERPWRDLKKQYTREKQRVME